MSIVFPYLYADDKCIILRVVKTSDIFFQEFDDGVIYLRHFLYDAYQLDVLNHPEISPADLFGRPSSRRALYNHSYISYGRLRMLIFQSGSLFLRWVRPLFADEPLQLSLPDKGFNLLFQVVTINCVMAVITVEAAVLAKKC